MRAIFPPRERVSEDARLRRLALYRDGLHRAAVATTVIAVLPLVLCIPLALTHKHGFAMVLQSPLFVIGAIGLIAGCANLWRIRTITLEQLEDRYAEAARLRAKVVTARPWYSLTLASCLIAVFAVQLVVGLAASVEAAGLVKNAVWRGEVWRLVTAEMLHVGLLHLWFNLGALLGLGRAIESIANRPTMAVTFLLSAISASVFSLVLMPNTTSVGASGGIMGLAGFLLVAGYQRRRLLPGLLRSMIVSTAFVGLAGLLGFAMIDNAAHLGGFIAGAGAAFAMIDKRDGNDAVVHAGRVTNRIGMIALGILVGACVLSAFVIIVAR